MSRPHWKITDLLLLVLASGLALGSYRYFWRPPPTRNPRADLSAYLAPLAIASLGSFFARPSWRRPCQGYALYSWCNLIFVMWGGFALTEISGSVRIVEGCRMGAVHGIIAALIAAWLLEPPGRPSGPP